MLSPLLHRLQALFPAGHTMTRRAIRMRPATLIEALPGLGSVLYVPMQVPADTDGISSPGLLVEAVQLAPLLHLHWLVAATLIGVDGPREWLDVIDVRGRLCARLHLLPDTDYLAWDALLASGEAVAGARRRLQWSRPGAACLLRFQHYRLAGLGVLAAEPNPCISPLGHALASRIVQAEALSWA